MPCGARACVVHRSVSIPSHGANYKQPAHALPVRTDLDVEGGDALVDVLLEVLHALRDHRLVLRQAVLEVLHHGLRGRHAPVCEAWGGAGGRGREGRALRIETEPRSHTGQAAIMYDKPHEGQ